ncbi:MAG TPA: type VI secretion system lipoprotein TssJ, partial [Variovorax sp.]|nr:type VI secretion system lipoprotein TssJ [Variovorax sp.]
EGVFPDRKRVLFRSGEIELKSDVAFQEADFFALQNNAKAVLGPDLLAVDQFIVRPGEQREIQRESHPETTAIGIFAGYRDLPQSVWRVVHKLPPAPEAGWYRMVVPSHKAVLRIELRGNAIVMTDMGKKARPTKFADESPGDLEKASPDAAVKLPEVPSRAASKAPAGGGGKLLRRPE